MLNHRKFKFLCPRIPIASEFYVINLQIADLEDFIELQNEFLQPFRKVPNIGCFHHVLPSTPGNVIRLFYLVQWTTESSIPPWQGAHACLGCFGALDLPKWLKEVILEFYKVRSLQFVSWSHNIQMLLERWDIRSRLIYNLKYKFPNQEQPIST